MNTDFQNLLNRFKDFPVIERRPSFLEIAGFPSRETVWRNIFAFFFNPNECHGFKDLFLRSFFDALGKEKQGTGDWELMTVRTECQTEKGNFLDLLITCGEFAIGIEMKVNAELYNDLADYGKLVKAKNQDDEHKVGCPVRLTMRCPQQFQQPALRRLHHSHQRTTRQLHACRRSAIHVFPSGFSQPRDPFHRRLCHGH